MRRPGPRPVSHALDALAAQLEPPTTLAKVQHAWPGAAGRFAERATPFAERDGEVLVACPDATWAQELDLMSDLVVQALNRALGTAAVRRLRVQARPAPRGRA